MTDNLKSIVHEKVEDNPSVMPRNLARELNVPEGEIIGALPDDMRTRVPASDFISVWETMTEWEKVTFFAETPGAIIEVSGALPKGKSGHGMYNLLDKNFPLGGHIMPENIASIWLVSKPIFNLESHSIQFFDGSGRLCFGIYLGRDASRTIIPSVKEGYLKLWTRYGGKTESGC